MVLLDTLNRTQGQVSINLGLMCTLRLPTSGVVFSMQIVNILNVGTQIYANSSFIISGSDLFGTRPVFVVA